jgi:hypothetical protein
MALGTIVKELLIAGGRAAATAIARALRGKARDEWVDVKVTDPPQPLSHKDVAHQQAQIRSATEPHDPAMCDRCAEGVCSGFGPPVNRNASTVRPGRPKPGTLPKK